MKDKQEEVGEILADGLTLIQDGQESIESWLKRFPQYKEILRPPLEAAKWLQIRSPIFDPQPEFVVSSRRNLVRQILFEQSLSAKSSAVRKGRILDDERFP